LNGKGGYSDDASDDNVPYIFFFFGWLAGWLAGLIRCLLSRKQMHTSYRSVHVSAVSMVNQGDSK
jgi:hypothetical protein